MSWSANDRQFRTRGCLCLKFCTSPHLAGVKILSINIISAKPQDDSLMNSLAQGAVAAAEARQAETAAYGRARALEVEAEGKARARIIEVSHLLYMLVQFTIYTCDICDFSSQYVVSFN